MFLAAPIRLGTTTPVQGEKLGETVISVAEAEKSQSILDSLNLFHGDTTTLSASANEGQTLVYSGAIKAGREREEDKPDGGRKLRLPQLSQPRQELCHPSPR